MKKASLFVLALAILVAPFSLASAYELTLGQGEEAEVTLLSADSSGAKVEINIPRILIEEKTAEGERYQVITIPGGGILTQVGEPQVPLVCRFVALPPTSGVRVEVIEEEKEVLSETFMLYPFQEPAIRSGEQEPQEFRLDEIIYSQNKPFPGKIVEAGEISILRDLRLAPIIFYPVQFNPQTGEVVVYKKIVVEIKFEGEGENPKLNPINVLTKSFYQTYQRFVLNFDQVKGGLPVVDGSVLIITYDGFYDQVVPLAEWKHKRGLTTYLVNLSEVGSSNTDIYNYIYDAYHTWPDPPEYVILVGDVQQIPTNSGLYCITDHKYVTVDGSDYFADIHIGRISVQTPAEAEHVITKILNYRRNPYVDETDWFLEAMTISGSDYVDDYNCLRCGFLMVDYAGFTYFDSLWNSNGLDTPSQITTRLNDGRSWIAYFGHGGSTAWYPSGFNNSHINALSNGEKLPSIVSIACNNGQFNVSGDCFAERWIKAGAIGAEKGAVIIAASTEGSAFFYSDTLSRGTFISYFADSNFHFTAALNEGKMYMYQHFPEGPGGTTERETQMYTTFGDPELDPWSGVPEDLEVTHPDVIVLGGAPFPVTVHLNSQPVEGALVCVMKDTEMYEVGRTDSNGEVILNPSPSTPGDADITITAHNAFAYEAIVPVAGGVFIVLQGWDVDDDSVGGSLGNDDGEVDPGETCDLTVVLRNLGNEEATQVSGDLSSSDPYVTITTSSSDYPDIPPGGTGSSVIPYRFTVEPDCSLGHVATFVLQISAAGPYSATDSFDITIGKKPVILVDDDDGESYDTFFVSALNSLEIPHDVWEVDLLGSPSEAVLNSYKAVVWTTGDDVGYIGNPSTLTPEDQANLQAYLEDGGRLFLSSQDLLYDNAPNDFIINYLHVAGHTDDAGINSVAGVAGDVISNGMNISLSYPFDNLSDYIVPGLDATGIFHRTGKTSPSSREGRLALPNLQSGSSGKTDYCALRYPATGTTGYQLVFFAFPFEAIPQSGADPNNAETVMEKIMNWFDISKPSFYRGDANGDSEIDIADVVFLINYLFDDGPEPYPLEAGDADCSGEVDIGDAIFLINYLFVGGPSPSC
ncbi:hypothetical protein AMJ44_10300 [candidate division WOR-1 bacterium DG_54_3]|uniref:Dockerin domain-containing protein n=1 Tax=candidate division WOR-1 bacterium DG_54_3 TaxID=1703775 RepID=A0A0S7XSJ2_UNCSA|nr:MAG: hypothetical protein AMJ44_10300 [candidate division WOR-1 bacterium DG_54_3]